MLLFASMAVEEMFVSESSLPELFSAGEVVWLDSMG